MTFVYMQEFKIGDRSTANYDFMKDKIGDQKIDGLIVHTAGFDDDSGVWRMLDVWESKEQADRFMEQVMGTVRLEELPRQDTATEKPLREARYELHDFVKN
jgi:hypothetical protein